jgi:hypothetical protein
MTLGYGGVPETFRKFGASTLRSSLRLPLKDALHRVKRLLLRLRNSVSVEAIRDVYAGMTEDAGHLRRWDALREQERGGGVAQIVDPDRRQGSTASGFLKRCSGTLCCCAAYLIREGIVIVLPCVAQPQSSLDLLNGWGEDSNLRQGLEIQFRNSYEAVVYSRDWSMNPLQFMLFVSCASRYFVGTRCALPSK